MGLNFAAGYTGRTWNIQRRDRFIQVNDDVRKTLNFCELAPKGLLAVSGPLMPRAGIEKIGDGMGQNLTILVFGRERKLPSN